MTTFDLSACIFLLLVFGSSIDSKKTRVNRYREQPPNSAPASFGSKTTTIGSGEIVIDKESLGRFQSIDTWRKQLKSIIHDDSQVPNEHSTVSIT